MLWLSAQLIEQLIEREIERGIPSKNIVLMGFSQGAAMAFMLVTVFISH